MTDKQLAKYDKRYYEGFLKKVLNKFIVGLLLLLSKLPFSVLYKISDFLCFLLGRIIRYRRKVILENLAHAFPEKPEEEIKRIAAKFYRHLTDLMVETVKMNGMSPKEMDKRISFKGLERFEELYNQNRSLIVLGMHHNNWEWGSAIQPHMRHTLLMLYNPVRGNSELENFILKSREKWGGFSVPVHKSARSVLKFNRTGQPTALWLGADQTPSPSSKFWTIFLHREAPFFSGPEKIAARTNQPVFFHRTKKIARGKYEVILTPLCLEPQKVDPNKILLDYIKMMEKVIAQEPENYLWSHRRWKHSRPAGISLIT